MTHVSYLYSAEKKVTGESVVSNDDAPFVHLSRRQLGNDVTDYAVRAPIALEREAIAHLIQLPVSGFAPLSLAEARDALRDINYPSRRIKALTRTAEMHQRLHDIQGVARELADVMTNNQDYEQKTIGVPIFNYSEAVQYASKQLYSARSERKLLLQLKSVGLEYDVAQKITTALFQEGLQPDDEVLELEELTGMSGTELKVAAILSEVNPALVTELTHRLQEESFVGFREQPSVSFYGFRGGSDDPTVFIRKDDVPTPFANDRTNVIVGTELPDRDRKTGLARRAVTLHMATPRHVAHSLLVWRNDHGYRTLSLAPSRFEYHHGQIIRPSTLAGLAMLAVRIGKDVGVDYESELYDLLKRNGRTNGLGWVERQREMAKLWPLVANRQLGRFMQHGYFSDIEAAFEGSETEEWFRKMERY